MNKIQPFLAGAALAAALGLQSLLVASAQEAPPPAQVPPAAQPQPGAAPVYDPKEPFCGTWTNGQWVPNGACGPTDYHSHVAGTITAVKGHLVTIQQTTQSLVINDQPALDRQTSGKVGVGRQIVAYGYWQNGTFYATRIE